jgi:hypothetical protein
MGTLVKTAQMVEDRVGAVRREFEPKVHSKLQEARAEWLELKSRPSGSPVKRTETHVRTLLIRTDSRLRLETANLIGRLIEELERVRRALPRKR